MSVPRSVGLPVCAALGALAFLAADFALARTGAGWFLNSGRGVLVVAAVLGVLAILVGSVRTVPLRVGGAALVAGAVVAMVGTLFVVGPGTIFPIVIVVGTAVIAVAVAAGTMLAALVRRRR
jgi:hypothetical protein